MPQQRQTVTDRLADVIEVVRLGRKTGLLTVERGEGPTLEEGAITFVNGQPVQARLGPYSGAAALQQLNRWGPCRFAFTQLPEGALHSHGQLLPLLGSAPARLARQGSQELPGPARPPRETRPAGQHQGSGAQASGPPTATRVTLPLPQNHHAGLDRPERSPGRSWPARAPDRAQPYESALRRMEQMGFSRAHRRLFLLIDGSRSPAELARLMGRSEEEIQRLLSDLERAGFIVSL
jgi:hypothetical protein